VVSYKGKAIVHGTKCCKNGLWYVPLSTQKHTTEGAPIPSTSHQANSKYHTSTIAETIQFLHQCFNSPTVAALTKAIDNNQLLGLPGHITSAAVRKYIPESTATHKGHMQRRRKGLRSTSKPSATPSSNRFELLTDESTVHAAETTPAMAADQELDFYPTKEADAEWELFIGAAFAETFDGTIYTDITGGFPITSYKGNKVIFFAYEYRTNAIKMIPLKSMTDEAMVATFRQV